MIEWMKDLREEKCRQGPMSPKWLVWDNPESFFSAWFIPHLLLLWSAVFSLLRSRRFQHQCLKRCRLFLAQL
jgi:hypothetical protein